MDKPENGRLSGLQQKFSSQKWEYIDVQLGNRSIKTHIRLFEHHVGEQTVRMDYRSSFANPMLNEYGVLRDFLTDQANANYPEASPDHPSRWLLTITADRMADDGTIETAVLFDSTLNRWKDDK